MLLQTCAALLVIAPFSALAQSWDSNTNFTIKLYPSDAEDKCLEGATGGITLTTETVPRSLTCIDVEKIFVGGQRVGFLNDSTSHMVSYGDHVDVDKLPPPGIDWYISSDSSEYDSSKNWTNIWFEQRNQTSDGESEEGEDGRWVVTTWANNKCERLNVSEDPWLETSCQTSEDGQCESVPYSIKGIGIRPYLNHDFDDCQIWAETGEATSMAPRVSVVLIIAVAHVFLLYRRI
ncbi:hypothetical protein ACHAQH_009246 [Verticillium albo-atrum]